jgi:2-aminoadipate transaminase
VTAPPFDLDAFLAFPARHAVRSYQDPPADARWLFEAGLPDPAVVPVDDLERLTGQVLREELAEALQYGAAANGEVINGYIGLRDRLAARGQRTDGRDLDGRNVMLTCGAVQALSLAFEAFVDPGDAVAIESPTWNAVLGMAQRRGADMIPLPIDDDGVQLDVLEAHLVRLAAAGRRLKLVYTIATFNTPTGVCLSLDRRRRLVELAHTWDFLVLEDNVYGDLRYAGAHLPTLFSLDDSGRVFKVDSFSKIVAPGLRVGWVTGHADLIATLASVRGDLGVSQLVTRVLDRYLQAGLLDPHIAQVNALYARKLAVAEAALHTHCDPWVRWRTPQGGFFLWVALDDAIDATEVMRRALTDGVLCRAGEKFFGDAALGRQWFRLAFPTMPVAEIERGIAVLGRAIAASRRPPSVLC